MTSQQPIGPVDATRVPRYAGPATFARLPRTDEVTHTDVAVVGIPFDSGVSYRPGARFGPGHIRASSKLLRPYHPRLDVEPFDVQQVADAGDIAVNPFDIAEAITTIERASDELRDGGTKLITLGGDHTIALPLLRSLHRDHGPIAVLHFDAHLDTWDTYFGAPFTHGTPFRRASEEGLLDPEHCLHVGIRGPLYASTDLTDDRVLGFQVKARYGKQAAFIAAGDYHHHIGINTWESLGAPPPPPHTTGLYHHAILYPTRAALADALRRLIAAGIPLDGASDHGVSEALYLRDPDDNGVELYWDRPMDQWPVNPDGSLGMFTKWLDLESLLKEPPL